MKTVVILFSLICLMGCSNSKPKTPQETVSFHRGYSFWKEQLKYAKVPYDIHQVIQGILAADKGEALPFSEDEIAPLTQKFKEEIFAKVEKENLEKAEVFLKTINHEEGTIEVVPGKLYYKVKKTGGGKALCQRDEPFIIFSVKTLDSEIYISNEEIQINMLDTIPGFVKGVLGMLEGEERILYIHPDLAYGNFSGKLDPNSLVIIDVKIVRISS